MTEHPCHTMAARIAALRTALGLTLAAMGERCGISKSQMHEVERRGRASVPVALAIEQLSAGQIDAADLNDDVRAARVGLSGLHLIREIARQVDDVAGLHGAGDTPAPSPASTVECGDMDSRSSDSDLAGGAR